jgi:hypothetical protein
MAKRPGSKSSRSERRAGRKRAERAREHGLPTRRDATPRARASTPQPRSGEEGEDRSSDAPRARASKPVPIPTLVKVVGGALVLLVGLYVVTLLRDEGSTDTKPAPEPVATSVAAVPEPKVGSELDASSSPVSPPVIAPEPLPLPPGSGAAPKKTVVATPFASAPSKPQLRPPLAPSKPAAPKPPAVPVAPVDNPY